MKVRRFFRKVKKKPNLKCHFERYELKYHITSRQRDIIVENIKNYLEEDPYNKKMLNNSIKGYYINSIYLDTIDNLFYYQKMDGILKRKKYRFRFYEQGFNKGGIFLEIKRKDDQISYKDRILLTKNRFEDLIEDCDLFYYLDKESEEDCLVLEEYLYDKYALGLEPCLKVLYFREAYFWEGNKDVRLTFDHNIKYKKIEKYNNNYFEEGVDGILFEIKIKGIMPFWLVNVIRKLNLEAVAFSKYCTGIEGVYPSMIIEAGI